MSRFGYILDRINLQNLCVLYFFLAPLFLDRLNQDVMVWVFGVGHLVSGTILMLATTEALSRFDDRVVLRGLASLLVAVAVVALFSVAANTPGNFLQMTAWYTKYLKIIFPLGCMLVMIRIWSLRDVSRLYALIVAFTLVSLLFLLREFIAGGFGLARLGKSMILFDDPNKFAVVLNIFYGLMLPKLIDAVRRGKPATHLAVACAATFIALFMLQTRSGIFACLVVSAVCVLGSRSRRVILYGALAFIPVVVFLTLGIMIRVTGAEGVSDSDLARVWTYMVGFNIVRDRPLLGVGFANILAAYDQYGGIYLYLLGRPLAIHNALLEVFAEQGIFGFAANLLAFVVPVVLLVRRIVAARDRYPVVELAALAIPVSFFCYGLFYHNYLTDDHFWIYMVIPLIVIRSRIPADFDLKLPRPNLL